VPGPVGFARRYGGFQHVSRRWVSVRRRSRPAQRLGRRGASAPAWSMRRARVAGSDRWLLPGPGVQYCRLSVLRGCRLQRFRALSPQDCGYQCVKPQSCVTPRPLACSRPIRSGNTSSRHTAGTQEAFRGNSFATLAQADQACQEALGPDYRVSNGSRIWGSIKLTAGYEYWIHNDLRRDANCWQTDRLSLGQRPGATTHRA